MDQTRKLIVYIPSACEVGYKDSSVLRFYTTVTGYLMSLSTRIEGGAKWLVNKVKGKMQKPLPELLKEYDLAIGIFPRDATNYEFNEKTRKLIVYIPSVCEVGSQGFIHLAFFHHRDWLSREGKASRHRGHKDKGNDLGESELHLL
ncbi:DUF538 family protein [Quillaja saponaria]|uniref:DUF538 family protein n=1 Tax=Quillaja saponaria TaxID=32244 RepID=A0AAD7QDQ2_QUISA|nr:DUF538 family protein [Quillaja saponaria]